VPPGRIDRRVARLDAEIAGALKASVWAESLACMCSAPGIGLVTAAWRLGSTLNFTLCPGPTALAAYAGLAPTRSPLPANRQYDRGSDLAEGHAR
jgi:hypothetical protein